MWKVSIPNKAKIHIWRVCLDILPSLGSLASKRVVLDSHVFVLCESQSETTLHLCRDCPFTKSKQSNAVLKQVCYNPVIVQSDLLDWLQYCARELSLATFGELMFLLWGVWKERNDRVWNQKMMAASDVSLHLVSRLQEFRFHNMKQAQSQTPRTRAVCWSAPSAGMLKINVDGSFNHVTRRGGLGFVVRNEFGFLLAGGACPLRGLISSEHAEVMACMKAAVFALDQALLQAVLETDALEVQRQLTEHNSTNTSSLGRLYDDLGCLLAASTNLRTSYVNRNGNRVAHMLAAHACTLSHDSFYFSTPSFLQAVVAAEYCNV